MFHISSTRKKSCLACVKSKRRCDLRYPTCKRCSVKGISCAYPTEKAAPRREPKVVAVRKATPDVAPLGNGLAALESQAEVAQPQGDIDPALLVHSSSSSSSSSSSPTTSSFSGRPNAYQILVDYDANHVFPGFSEPLMPQIKQIWEPTILSPQQVTFMVDKLRSFVPAMALSGSNPFIHERTSSNWQPTEALDNICAISSLYMCKTARNSKRNNEIITRSIDKHIAALISSARDWSLQEHLAAVQSLIMYQIIRLFDPDLNLQALADRQNTLLAIWSAHLWKRYFNETDPTDNCYDSWAFQETLRRTVLMSVFIRGTWSAFTRDGYCDQVPVLAKLPLTRDGHLWASDMDDWLSKRPCTTGGGHLISYADMTITWSQESLPSQLPEYERLLLVACRGSADPRLLEEV